MFDRFGVFFCALGGELLTSVYEIAKNYDLKPKEIAFLRTYLASNISITDTYRKIKKSKLGATEESLRRSASRYFARIKQKINWPEFLEMAGLGMDSIVKDLNDLRQAMKTIFYEGKAIADCIDNTIRLRAIEVVIDLHSLRKQEIKHSGSIGGIITIVRPSS